MYVRTGKCHFDRQCTLQSCAVIQQKKAVGIITGSDWANLKKNRLVYKNDKPSQVKIRKCLFSALRGRKLFGV